MSLLSPGRACAPVAFTGLREDADAQKLFDITKADADMHRMSQPVELREFDHEKILLQPRFAVTQTRLDGSSKTRAVDHFSW